MKKINKILLPITSIAAVAAPAVCMTACSGNHFVVKKVNYDTTKIVVDSALAVKFKIKGCENGSSIFDEVNLDEHIKTSDDSLKNNINEVVLHLSHDPNESDYAYIEVLFYFNAEYQPKIGDKISIYVTVTQIVRPDKVLWKDSSWLDAVCK